MNTIEKIIKNAELEIMFILQNEKATMKYIITTTSYIQALNRVYEKYPKEHWDLINCFPINKDMREMLFFGDIAKLGENI